MVSLTTLMLRLCGCATCLRDLASNVATMLKRSGNRIRFRQFCLNLQVVKWLYSIFKMYNYSRSIKVIIECVALRYYFVYKSS